MRRPAARVLGIDPARVASPSVAGHLRGHPNPAYSETLTAMTTTVAQHMPATPSASSSPERVNLLGMSREQMEAFFLSIGEKKFRASQVMKWIHLEGYDDFDAMTNLSKALRSRLAEVADVDHVDLDILRDLIVAGERLD
mgnify:CR=1 FL=1